MARPQTLFDFLSRNTMPAAAELAHHEEDGIVRCLACGNRCRIPEGESGICRLRTNRNGELRVPGGYVAGLQIDPIEKKPFFHVFPGCEALSFGMIGCNLHCGFCQNWLSSQAVREGRDVPLPHICDADGLVQAAVSRGAPVIVSTYNEPLVTADWAAKIFEKAREHGITCGFVSNGNATPEVLTFLRPFMDLYKVDLKTFSAENYRALGCDIRNVLDTISRLKTLGFWVEVVTLVVPGFNDSSQELHSIARFVAGVSPDIPWHVTAFHPDYQMTNRPATTPQQLERAYDAGKDAGLRFVYCGNLPGKTGNRENTYCPSCSALLVERHGFYVRQNRVRGGCCPDCSVYIPGVWDKIPPPHRADSASPCTR